METYSLTVTTFVNIVITIVMMGIVLLPVLLIGKRILEYEVIGRPARRSWSQIRNLRSHAILPGVLLLLIVLYYWWLLKMLTQYSSDVDVAVGELKVYQLDDVSGLAWIYYRTVFVCLFSYLIYSHFAAFAQQPKLPPTQSYPSVEPPQNAARRNLARYTWMGFLLATALLALQLPILYGRLVHVPIYPLVEVNLSDHDYSPVCGLLVLETATTVSLWHAKNGIGQVDVLPRSSVRSTTTGQTLNLLTLAREAVANHTSVRPECSDSRKPDE